jgi:hypothetical protein
LKPLGKAAASLAALVLAFALAGCGGDDGGDGDTGPTPTEATVSEPTNTGPSTIESEPSDGTTIEVTVEGDTVTPNGERVDVDRGEQVHLVVTADAAGEIHVHSDPEQEFEYDAGTTTLTLTNLDRPGLVEVESHTLDKVIVQLEVK